MLWLPGSSCQERAVQDWLSLGQQQRQAPSAHRLQGHAPPFPPYGASVRV